jgi:hypothetical protein
MSNSRPAKATQRIPISKTQKGDFKKAKYMKKISASLITREIKSKSQ